jgi:hypothetical protein
MRAYRIPAAHGEDPLHDVGADQSRFPTGVNHVENHPVAKSKPVIKNQVGPYISNLIQGPEAFHGVESTQGPRDTHDQYLKAEEMATMHVPYFDDLQETVDPVPVFIVAPDSTSQSIQSVRFGSANVDVASTGATGGAIDILPEDFHRRRCVITNEHATVGVRLGGTREEAKQGFLLKAGDKQDFFATTAIWAWPADSATVIPVSYASEYSKIVST